MIADLKPYPALKDSGVEWLGEVPKHWDVRRLKYLLREQDTRSVDGSEQLLRVSQYTGVTERKSEDGTEAPDTRAASLVGYKCVGQNELVVNIMLAWNGSMGVSAFPGIASPAYCVYRLSDQAAPWYFHYLLRSTVYKARIKAVSTGIVESRMRLYTDELYRLEGLLPPLPEQAAIVRFLDRTDRRIRRYIRSKQKLVKLLEEQKQAILHRAITRGLDPNVRLKPSGVEWLGDVPEHWEVKRLKWVTHLQRGYDLPADRRVSGPYPVVSSGGIIDTHSEARCNGPGVVMGRYGSTDAVFFVDHDFWPHNTSLFVTDFQCNSQKWCYYLLRSITKADHAGKSAVPGIDRKDLFQILVPAPPVDEQAVIVTSIEARSQELNDTISTAQREIVLLREYRTRLIADVVTGKLDVREAVRRIPDEGEEPEPLNEADVLAEAEEATADDLDAIPEEAEA